MKQTILLFLLFVSLTSNTMSRDLHELNTNISTNRDCDSIIVKGRAVEEKQHRNPKYIEPIEGVIFVFMDYSYKDSLLKDPLFYQKDSTINIPRENYSITDKNGCFALKLAKGNYIAESSYIGLESGIINIIADSTVVDLGDIELKEIAIDDNDSFVKVKASSRVKLFFRRLFGSR